MRQVRFGLRDFTTMRKARVGHFSVYDYDTKVTYVDETYCVEIDGIKDTIGYHVGQELSKVRFSRGDRGELSTPLFAMKSAFSDAVYVDIKHAFRQIASVWGAEVLMKGNRPIALGNYKYDGEIFNEKLARGMIVSLVHNTTTEQIWEYNKLHSTTKPNYRYAPSLLNAIYSTLHSLAMECFPVLYWNTDGMIVPIESLNRIEDTLEKYKVKWTIKKRGSVKIYGVGCYAFNGEMVRRKSVGDFCNLVDFSERKYLLSVYRNNVV